MQGQAQTSLPIYARTRTVGSDFSSRSSNLRVIDHGAHNLILQPETCLYHVKTFVGRNDIVLHSSNYESRKPLPIPVWRSGFKDGSAKRALFNKPTGMAIDQRGCLYVADSLNHCIRKISRSGHVKTIAGNGERGHQDARGNKSRFNHPTGLALAPGGELYVVDQGNHALRAILPSGDVYSIPLPGKPLGGIAVDSQGTIYLVIEWLADSLPFAALARLNSDQEQWQILSNWENELQWQAYRQGEEEQPFSRWWNQRPHRPSAFELGSIPSSEGLGLAIDPQQNLLWLTGLHLYRLIPQQSTRSTQYLQLQRQALKIDSWPGRQWQGLSVDQEGVIHVLDARHHTLYRIRPGQDPEQILSAGLHGLLQPYSVVSDGYGQLYISDTGHWRVCRLTPPGSESLLRLAKLAFMPYFPIAPQTEKGAATLATHKSKQAKQINQDLVTSPQIPLQHALDVLHQGNRSQQLACAKEIIDQLKKPVPRHLTHIRTLIEICLDHPQASVRTLMIRHICDTVHQEQDALFWIELLEQHQEPNRLLKKYIIEVLAYLGKRYQLYGHVVPLIVDYIRSEEEDVVEQAFGHLMRIRKAGYESLVDPLVEELSET